MDINRQQTSTVPLDFVLKKNHNNIKCNSKSHKNPWVACIVMGPNGDYIELKKYIKKKKVKERKL